MTITRQSSDLFYVEHNIRYLVDVRAFDWNGSCTCDAFTGCCLFLLKHQDDSRNRWRCQHILAVREWIMEYEFPELLSQAEKIIPLPTKQSREDGSILSD